MIRARSGRQQVAQAALAVVLTVGIRLDAQEDSPDETALQEPAVRRQLDYTGLWPFFSREIFEGGYAKTSILAGLIRSTSEPDGDYHHHFLPFYDVSIARQGEDRRLAIFPLLYFARRSPESSYDHLLPIFSRWRADSSSHVLSWPLFHVAHDPQETPYYFIPTLLRVGSHAAGSDQRLGVPFIFSLLEHAKDASSRRWAIGNFFNFSETADSGLPLWYLAAEGSGEVRSHLFPLYAAKRAEKSWYAHTPLLGLWQNEGPQGEEPFGVVVPPLLFFWYRRDPEHVTVGQFPTFAYSTEKGRDLLFILPFYLSNRRRSPPSSTTFYSFLYGHTVEEDTDSESHLFPLLLSRVGRLEGRRVVDVLWPLGHYSRHVDGYSVRAVPLFDRWVRGPERQLGIGSIVFRRYTDSERGIRSTWAPLPLVHWKTSPEGLVAWAVPAFYHERWNEDAARGSMTVGLPLYYSTRSEVRVVDGTWAPEARSLHLWPFFGFEWANEFGRVEPPGESESPGDGDVGLERRSGGDGYDERSYWTLFPFLRVDRNGRESSPSGVETRVHAPWPLVRYRRDRDSADAYLWPLLFAGTRTERTYFRLWPAISSESGSQARRSFWNGTSVFQWFANDSEQELSVFPLLFDSYVSRDTEGRVERRRVAGPLFWFLYSRSAEEGWFHLLPLGFGSWSETESSLGVFPFFYRRRFGAEIDYWTAGRFFFLWNSLEGESASHAAFLWKVVDWTSTADGDFDFRILHRFVVSRAVGGQRELTVNPFFTSFSDDRTGERRFSFLKFVYRSEVEDGVKTRRVFFVPVWRSEVR